MRLRNWQQECIEKALECYRVNSTYHFMCLATPGSGKTVMASVLAKILLESSLIDMAICFSPSTVVAQDFSQELEAQTGKRFDGRIGASGCSFTYQGMLGLPDAFWDLLASHRVFVIFDEIHHCSGSNAQTANAWGEKIISNIQGKAQYTLALTGTPWRSDCIPITLASYCDDDGHIRCDFQYGLEAAIRDGVCRRPFLKAIDNNRIEVKLANDSANFESFKELLESRKCNYQDLIQNEVLITHLLKSSNSELNKLRKRAPDSGGLIVASNVSHAQQIASILHNELNEEAVIATYQENDPTSIIRKFKANGNKWIISVGMISEGTNIPRLRVCCYLTNVKTELYFRQVLGRVLRVQYSKEEIGYLYMPAEPNLIEYAKRIAEDIPNHHALSLDATSDGIKAHPKKPSENRHIEPNKLEALELDLTQELDSEGAAELRQDSSLTLNYLESINIHGEFKEGISQLRSI